MNHGREASLQWWHCLFPNFVVEYKISFLVTGRSQYLEASKQAKNCWWFGYTLYQHITFERGLTKLHRIFRMTHIDDANVIPCCCLWQNWFSCVLASMPSPLMFELRILLKTHGVYIKKQGGKSQVPTWQGKALVNRGPKSTWFKVANPRSKVQTGPFGAAKSRLETKPIQNPKSKTQHPKSKVRNHKSETLNPKSETQNPKSEIQNLKSNWQIWDFGSTNRKFGSDLDARRR